MVAIELGELGDLPIATNLDSGNGEHEMVHISKQPSKREVCGSSFRAHLNHDLLLLSVLTQNDMSDIITNSHFYSLTVMTHSNVHTFTALRRSTHYFAE